MFQVQRWWPTEDYRDDAGAVTDSRLCRGSSEWSAGDLAFQLSVDEWRGDPRECNQCQRPALWLVREDEQRAPTFRCALHAWEALERLQDAMSRYIDFPLRRPQGLTG